MFYVIIKNKENRIEFKFYTFKRAIDFMQLIYPYLEEDHTIDMIQTDEVE